MSGGTKLFSAVTSASTSSTRRLATSFGSRWSVVTKSPMILKSSASELLSDCSLNHSHIDCAIAERKKLENEGVTEELKQVYYAEDLARGSGIVFCATGISDSPLLPGVRFIGHTATTHSIVMRAKHGRSATSSRCTT